MGRYMIIVLLFFVILALFAAPLNPADWKAGLTDGWRAEDLQAWGNGNLAVDFGAHGIWNYRGEWVQLSRLNPQMMEALGGNRLAVDFGDDGLWIFDMNTWNRITRRLHQYEKGGS